MNTSNSRYPSGPECARYAPLLSQFRHETLAPDKARALRAHLATCAYCQAQLATYDRLDGVLRTYIDHFAPTAPPADDLVRNVVERVSSAPTAMASANHHRTLWVRRKDDMMYERPDRTDDAMTLPAFESRPPRTPRRHPVLATVAALLLIGLAATLFTLFARASHDPAQRGTPTATAQSTVTVEPTATEQPTQSTTIGIVNSGHPCTTDTSGQTSYVWIGDLKVSKARFGLAYPANQLPANLDPSKPYQLPDNMPNPPNPPVNPHTSGGFGYGLTICNTSGSASHVIRGITVRIAAFSAYSGPLNTYQFCDGFYQRPNGAGGGGCGGGIALDERLQASFAADATTGAQVTTTQVGTGNPEMPPLPVKLGPGQMLIISLGVTPPTSPGTYTFAFGLNYDNVTTAPISTMTPTIFDSAAVTWNGQNCSKPALLGQIPSNSTARYVCAP